MLKAVCSSDFESCLRYCFRRLFSTLTLKAVCDSDFRKLFVAYVFLKAVFGNDFRKLFWAVIMRVVCKGDLRMLSRQ
jgi:hypothetical protein